MTRRAANALLGGLTGAALIAVAICVGPDGAPRAGHRVVPLERSAPAVGSPPAGHWSNARVISPTALGATQGARIDALACASPGNCTAGGSYADRLGRQIFVVSEVSGTWRRPEPVPGLTGLSHDAGAIVSSLSCPTAGNCAMAGRIDDGSGDPRPFIAESKNGRWGSPVRLTFGRAIVKPGPDFEASSVSCAAPGDCTAGLTVPVSAPSAAGGVAEQAYVADEVNGSWQAATPIPDLPKRGDGLDAGVSSLSCYSPGDCLAGGWYSSGVLHAFVATETDGAWGAPIPLPGLSGLPGFGAGSNSVVSSVSCVSAGNCGAAGTYFGVTTRGFAAVEVDGAWTTQAISGDQSPDTMTTVNGVSCGGPGRCTVAGTFTDSSGSRAFVWSRPGGAQDLAGIDGNVEADLLACAADHCVVGGTDQDPSGSVQAFVAEATSGRWGPAQPISENPPAAGSPAVLAVSCAAAGHCAIGGVLVAGDTSRAFVADRTP